MDRADKPNEGKYRTWGFRHHIGHQLFLRGEEPAKTVLYNAFDKLNGEQGRGRGKNRGLCPLLGERNPV